MKKATKKRAKHKVNPLYKDIKEYNVIFLMLIGLALISISGYSSYAYFTSEIISENEIGGPIRKPSLDESEANAPVLAENMIPVFYDESSKVWRKADKSNADGSTLWYDYNNKILANAVTTTAADRETYLNASPGIEIPMPSINAMWVWIPRYKYTYFASTTPVEIPITFEKGTKSTGTIKCVENISANSGASETCTDETYGSIQIGVSTYTHPAFTFGGTELRGLWVGKFENAKKRSDDETITIAPSLGQIRSMTISEMFQKVRQMELKDNVYGFSQNGTTLEVTGKIQNDSNNLDVHLMKNTEWGAMAYFSHSKYGVVKKLGINNYSGYSAGSTYNTGTGCGAASGLTSSNTCNAYNTTNGQLASNNGNIYGIYDTSGGVGEYVMANMYNTENQFYPRNSGTWSATEKPLEKYYDKYSYGVDYSNGKLGDATKEINPQSPYGWYTEHAIYFADASPWIRRGGYYLNKQNAGTFNFVNVDGAAANFVGFRTALIITE